MYLFLLFQYKMQPFSWRNLWVVAVTAVTILLVGLIPEFENMFVDIGVRSVAVTAAFVPAILLPRIAPDINNMINTQLKRFR